MSDYLRSALGYLNGGTSGGDGEYVGQTLEINNVRLKVTRLIAEGGWSLVFAVEDVATGKEYALKRLIALDEETNKDIIQEIETLKRLSGHPNIIQYLHAQRLERENQKGYEYLVVTELCPGGTVADILRSVSVNTLTLAQVCKIAYQATRAVHHMHSQQPEPLIHRDVKLENFLLGRDGLVKLCDFGSASTQQILPSPSWNAQKRATLEDQMAKYTTPMYRAPEMMDTWNNEPIGPPVDCWALGCILYALITLRHPFPGDNKLSIVNGKYSMLLPNPRYACLHDLVKGCLQVSPIQRLTTATLLERLAAIAESNNFDPREPPRIEVAIKPSPPPRPTPPQPTSAPAAPPRPNPPAAMPPPRPVPVKTVSKPPQGFGLFNSIKGTILRNLKDTSSKVMHSVQQSMARTELDASYLTSRILIMPYPADGIESAYRANHVEDVRAFLQTRHPPPAKIQLYNLSRGRPNVTRLPGKHVDCSFAYATSDSNALMLFALYQICQDIYQFLNADFNHVVVLYCNDGYRACATVACSLLIHCGAFATTEEAISLFTTRRCQSPNLQVEELRSISYMSLLSNGTRPHTKPLVLRSITMQPVPRFTRAKDGCRPYVEVYCNGALVFTTRKPNYEEMRLFSMMEGKVRLKLGDVTVRGDITIIVYHARQQLGRVIGIKMTSLHFHTGYMCFTESESTSECAMSPEGAMTSESTWTSEGTLTSEKCDLDDAPEVGGKFHMMLHVVKTEENPKLSRIPAPWEAETSVKPVPDPLFGSTLEMEETLENFRTVTGKTQPAVSSNELDATVPQHEVTHEADNSNEEEEEVAEMKNEENSFQEADLLNLGMPDSTSINTSNTPTAATVNPGLDIFSNSSQNESDLLGGFGLSSTQVETANSIPLINNSAHGDLLFGHEESTKSNAAHNNGSLNDFLFGQNQTSNVKEVNDFLFDPLGGNSASNLIGGLQAGPKPNNLKSPNTEESFPRNASVPNFGAQSKDPFANLAGSLGAGLTSSWNGTPKNSNTPQSASPAPASTPIHSSPNIHKSSNTNSTVNNDATNHADAFGNKATKEKSSGDAFEDLLGSQGYNFFSSRKADKDSPKTINQMRKVEAAKTMDPDRLKISEWTEGKKGNLRALLCSLHTVLWPEADRWQRCEMHQLVTVADVKKAYRRACLAVHPDKQAGTVNENIAKLIFMELNNAWSTFENDASQQNLFN
ncbi:PREDICTED: cyclin-G-associated kinase [Dinoponera quadriceps]|uniref:Cyclin-G-associated kinase n=1 Tax=Dinoponera quadriceps TaxID=609295 RepID=A0A6P3XSU8_DINQU|nr:PREDICTED: cyclin-G-associated kinase [Dinoponera quadriceps]XP_014481591.1 PREDICTED: cyclin-G-associated kinase [Dinoponera quadriceps]